MLVKSDFDDEDQAESDALDAAAAAGAEEAPPEPIDVTAIANREKFGKKKPDGVA